MSAVYAMLFVLAMSAAGVAAGVALFLRREVHPMPLYEVRRTDAVQPGEFDNALVIAGGRARARAAVAPVSYTHLTLPTICSV